jgi:hypothetical protein
MLQNKDEAIIGSPKLSKGRMVKKKIIVQCDVQLS